LGPWFKKRHFQRFIAHKAEKDVDLAFSLTLRVGQDVKCVKFHPRGVGPQGQGILVSASYDDTLKVWAEDGDDWTCVQTLVAHSSTVWSLSFAPVGGGVGGCVGGEDAMASVSDDGSLVVWRTATAPRGWSAAERVQAHSRPALCVDWGSHGFLATSGSDNAIRVFTAAPLAVAVEIEAHAGDVNCVAWCPTQPFLLASAGDDFMVRLWRFEP
jgi:WD40 repeat protein